jgi:hypothetical protein
VPALLLAVFLACDPAGSGCGFSPLQRDLDPTSLGPSAVEFYLPPGSGVDLSTVIMELLREKGADQLTGTLPGLTGSLGGPLEFVSSETELVASVTEISAELGEEKILVEIELEAAEEILSLEVLTDGTPLRTCFINISIPQRWLNLALVVESDYSGKARIRVEGEPMVSNGSVSTELDLDCPEQPGSDIHLTVTGALEEAYGEAAEQLAADLAEVTSSAIGVDLGQSGSSGPAEGIHFSLQPGPEAAVSAEGALRVGLTGGVEADLAACIPQDVVDLPPASEPPAKFADLVPGTDQPYSMGISISQEFLNQGLTGAYRGGLLCRLPSAGDLPGVKLRELFESLEGLGELSSIRAAIWPGTQPRLDFTAPDTSNGEVLPRVALGLENLSVDIYVGFEGADIRLLGLTANVTLHLIPVLEENNLRFDLAESTIRDLEVVYSKVLLESANQLRAQSALTLERILTSLVLNLPQLQIPRPIAAAGQLLESEQSEGRLLLYFNP